MKKIILLLIILLVGNQFYAQKTLTKVEKYATTAKIWGFLKYYHPMVAKGNNNWDEQLFEILDKIDNANTKEDLSKIYLIWISSLGKIEDCDTCNKASDKKYFNKNFDMSWMKNQKFFTPELTKALKYIENNRHQGEGYYVKYKSLEVGNLQFRNEWDKDLDWQNQKTRLLALFRYWNIIEYFFPYKYQTDIKWDDVLYKMIPKFLNQKSKIEFHLAILELVVSIDDSHAGFYSKETYNYFGSYRIPASFSMIDGSAIVTEILNDSLANVDDIRIGDIIIKVNHQEVDSLFLQNIKYINGSNLSRKKHKAMSLIFNGTSDSVNIEYRRGNVVNQKIVRRYQSKDIGNKPEKETYKILDGNIGYIDMSDLKKQDVSYVMDSLKNTKAIIFDIRNYPNFIGYELALYISSKKNDFFDVIYPDLDYPGKFLWEVGNKCGKNGELKYKGKVVLLVNEKSQSRAEFITMMLQTGDNVITIGSQTSGADGDVEDIEIVRGCKTMISGIGIFYPKGIEAQRKGVKIDIEVKPTIQGIIAKKDEVLEKAIEYSNQ